MSRKQPGERRQCSRALLQPELQDEGQSCGYQDSECREMCNEKGDGFIGFQNSVFQFSPSQFFFAIFTY